MATRGVDALDDKGYVVYTRESTNPRWEIARQKQESIIEGYYSSISAKPTLDQYIQVGEYLKSLGAAEEKKEKELISEVFGKNYIDAKTEIQLINQFNEVLRGKAQYKETLDRISIALTDNQKKWGPSKAVFYADKFVDVFFNKIDKFVTEELPEITIKQKGKVGKIVEKRIFELYDESITEGFSDMLNYTNKSGIEKDQYGTGTDEEQRQIYRDLSNLFNEKSEFGEAFRELTKDNLRGVISDKALKTLANKITQKIKINKSSLKSTLKLTGRESSVGGFGQEVMDGLKDSIPENVDISQAGAALTSQKPRIDNMTIIDITATVDKKEILTYISDLSKQLDNTQNLAEVHRVMMDYWNNYLSKLDSSFIVFKSSKLYSFNSISEYGGFKNGSKISLEGLKRLPKSNSFLNNIDIDKFVMVVANTINGPETAGVLAKNYDNIREWLYTYIFESIASLMFDDWELVGNEMASSSAKAIHVLLLEDINIPFSIFLKGAGQSLIQTTKEIKPTDFVNIVVNRSKIKYPNPDSYKGDADVMVPNTRKDKDKRGIDRVPNVAIAWNKQRNDALQNFGITVKFYRNFNELVLNKLTDNII